jgi:hypothetical protein
VRFSSQSVLPDTALLLNAIIQKYKPNCDSHITIYCYVYYFIVNITCTCSVYMQPVRLMLPHAIKGISG